MLREIIELTEGASWSDDAQLVFSDITKLVEQINRKISSGNIDARVYRSLEMAKDQLEKAFRRM